MCIIIWPQRANWQLLTVHLAWMCHSLSWSSQGSCLFRERERGKEEMEEEECVCGEIHHHSGLFMFGINTHSSVDFRWLLFPPIAISWYCSITDVLLPIYTPLSCIGELQCLVLHSKLPPCFHPTKRPPPCNSINRCFFFHIISDEICPRLQELRFS
jgi:hypothetical protein